MVTTQKDMDIRFDPPFNSDEELLLLRKEYENYTYIVSHDLAAPLRHIQQFSSLLLNSLNGDLDERQVMFSKHISSAVERCQSMLDALMLLSRVDTGDHIATSLDLDKLIQQTAEFRSAEERPDELIFDLNLEPSTVEADAAYIQTVIKHLIDNAVSFKKNDTPLQLKITTQRDGDLVQVKFEDNGIGIDAKHCESVFAVFSTLEHGDANAGVGVGLPLCRKILSKYAGKIWCETNENDGTTFIFTLPFTGH